MPPFRLAHYSDIHVTLTPTQLTSPKRLVGAANYVLSRRRRFAGVEQRIENLLVSVDALVPDHALCTGDLTAIATRREFDRCAALFGEQRLAQPERLTVLPGNHDRYTRDAVEDRLFERHFERVCRGEGEGFPFVKRLRDDVMLVVADVARPCSLLDSSGLCGPTQREKLRAILTNDALRGRFVILALHYGLLHGDGSRDHRQHGIRDDVELMALLDEPGVHLDLVLHGHMHEPYAVRLGRRWEVCAGSATDLRQSCGFNVYELDPATKGVGIQRFDWDRATGRYEVSKQSPYPARLE